MRVAIIGSRDFTDYNNFCDIISQVKIDIEEIVSGGATGADSLAKRYAVEKNIKLTKILPDYNKFKRGAPLIRNKTIVDRVDCVIAFWNGKSRGTKFTIDYAAKRNKPITVISI